jgi:hypothetical protein
MSFDKDTRNLLAKTVTACRRRLTEDVTSRLTGVFGLHPDGTVLALKEMSYLSPDQAGAAGRLRDLLDHYTAGAVGGEKDRRKSAYERMTLEISFTIFNRLAALRLCEERGLVVECVRKGTASDGFRLFERVSGGALGGRYDTYRVFLECLFDELALDLGLLFDRMTPQSSVFPTERCMEDVLGELNKPELSRLWTEDETIGWVYQYFNPKELREAIKNETKVPRNSYEIALRSSYYTPRFVVEYLTDNTLGRIWYEMRRGDTALKNECRYLVRRPNEVFLAAGEKAPPEAEGRPDLSQEELLKQPVYIEHRPKKDPRDLSILDPACGSGHFLLYAFDLLERIYEEAWGDPISPKCGDTGRTLPKDFETLDDLRREIPKLIIEHNLHGIDIDPRAVQIAALALWLRAQKAWKNLGIKAAERPRVAKSNIVTAEPMPGEADMKDEFAAGLKPRVLGQIVDVVFEKMKLAGEAGSLLKIEEEIKDAVAEARKQWLEGPKMEQGLLFPDIETQQVQQLEMKFDVSGVTDKGFWEQAEDRILDALKDYAEQAENGHAARRRLFAEDAAKGFAFIDICRNRYDLVLMNPPYSETEGNLQEYLKHAYPQNWTNFYSAFIERSMTFSRMRVGLVCPDGFLSAYRMRNLRSAFVERERLESFSCLGKDVFADMGLSTIAMVLNSRSSALHPILIELSEAGPGHVDCIDRAVVNARTNHILTPDLIRGGSSGWTEEPLSPTYGLVTQGNRTFDDFRFIRLWWEVPPDGIGHRWQRWQKGGEYQPFFSSTPYVTDWDKDNDGASMRLFGIGKVGTDAQVAQSSRYWWLSGLVGPALNTTGGGFNLRVLPKDQIFSAKSTVIIPKNEKHAFVLLCLLNSRTLRWFLYQQGAGLGGNTGKIKKLPIIWPEKEMETNLESLARRATGAMADLESFRDTSPCFKNCTRRHAEFVAQYRDLAVQVDEIVAALYQQNVEDESVKPTSELTNSALVEATDGHILNPHGETLLTYCLGMVFGRWDSRIALDPSLAPELRDPFDVLPVCPPGMLVGPDGLPAEANRIVSEEWLRARPDANTLPPDGSVKNPTIPDSGYPLRISWDGVLVDDPGFNGAQPHRDDIVRRVREVLDLLWKDKAHEIEQEACDILGVSDLRDYFRKPAKFFQDHLKRYSKSRRKAPIYWPLSTASGSYTLWIYYHRLTDQTLYTAVNKYVEPKISEVERGLRHVEDDLKAASGGEATRLRDRLNETQTFLGELRDLCEDLLRIAALPYKPDLNDGVIINAAPLNSLFNLRSWANDTKKIWDKLKKGDYDWAHLAYTIWPDRVRDVCKKDRSIAIAHGLEELCEVENPTGKKKGGRGRRRKENS